MSLSAVHKEIISKQSSSCELCKMYNPLGSLSWIVSDQSVELRSQLQLQSTLPSPLSHLVLCPFPVTVNYEFQLQRLSPVMRPLRMCGT